MPINIGENVVCVCGTGLHKRTVYREGAYLEVRCADCGRVIKAIGKKPEVKNGNTEAGNSGKSGQAEKGQPGADNQDAYDGERSNRKEVK